jgi:DNA-directed RNA polymerase specialized sigma24 family protein
MVRADYAGVYSSLLRDAFRALRRRGAGYDLAEELAAGACARAVNRPQNLRNARCLSAYVIAIAVNMLRDEVARCNRLCPLMPEHDRPTPPQTNVMGIDLDRALRACGPQGELLRKRYLLGQTTAEIAKDLRVDSADAVRHRVARATKTVRKHMLGVGVVDRPVSHIQIAR